MATSRKCKGPASKATSLTSLPDFTLSISLSAIRQLPAAALKQYYTEWCHLPGEAKKFTLAQTLYDYLHTEMETLIPAVVRRAAQTKLQREKRRAHLQAVATVYPRASTPPRQGISIIPL